MPSSRGIPSFRISVCVCLNQFSVSICAVFSGWPTLRMRDILTILKFMLPTRIRTFTQLLELPKVFAFQFSCPKTVQFNLHFHFSGLRPKPPQPRPQLFLVPLNITSGYVVENWFILFPLTV